MSLTRKYRADTAEAQDAAQDIFIDLWEMVDRFDPGKVSEYAFVTMTAHRRLIDRRRRRGRPLLTVSLGESTEPPQPQADTLQHDDTLRMAQQALQNLPVSRQQVIRYSIYEGLPHSQISE